MTEVMTRIYDAYMQYLQGICHFAALLHRYYYLLVAVIRGQ